MDQCILDICNAVDEYSTWSIVKFAELEQAILGRGYNPTCGPQQRLDPDFGAALCTPLPPPTPVPPTPSPPTVVPTALNNETDFDETDAPTTAAPEKDDSGTPGWVWVMVGLGAVVVLVVGGVLVWFFRHGNAMSRCTFDEIMQAEEDLGASELLNSGVEDACL